MEAWSFQQMDSSDGAKPELGVFLEIVSLRYCEGGGGGGGNDGGGIWCTRHHLQNKLLT